MIFEMNQKKRNEADVFSELSELCILPGYVHAIAYFCFRDNTIRYGEEMTHSDVLDQYGFEKLIRTEISTLIGLACKGQLEIDLPTPDIMQDYIDQTDFLLKELHFSIIPGANQFRPQEVVTSPPPKGDFLREAIFYGGEAAYNFQYTDLSTLKYQGDGTWLHNNKGFTPADAVSIIYAIQELQTNKLSNCFPDLDSIDPDRWAAVLDNWTTLGAFTFTIDEIAEISAIPSDTIQSFVESFVSPISMDDFSSLDDFNPKNAYPIIKITDSEYILFQLYSLAEALYETPFFWFFEDKSYRSIAMKNRGSFTETFSAERLTHVFGEKNVFLNVEIIDTKSHTAGEIDVLIIYANRAIVLQAKSKKLTLASRKGNDLSLKTDFKKAVQDAYNQAFSCAACLSDPKFTLLDSKGNTIEIKHDLVDIYPFCVVSDHYPALSIQARQFLDFQETEQIKPPFVMDVFFLDVLTEMLDSPLHFLNYVNRRTGYTDAVLSSHELTVLSFHLTHNLWVSREFTMMHLGDDICASLDLAMLARRQGIPGAKVPTGILTKFVGTTVGRWIKQIEKQEDPATIDFGFMLLRMSEDTIDQINQGVDHLAMLAISDQRNHDLTLAIESSGLTVHCNHFPLERATSNLREHASKRKYGERSKEWFGICVEPISRQIRFGIKLDYEWEHSDELDRVLADSPKPQRRLNLGTTVKGRKIGRNEACPCGSGLKYKKCCLFNPIM